jgi:hypothetical protein|tara:strand:- start:208 stop:402 length:195 start_codon:yes stop_codon:yes gene_type:complete
MKVKIKETIFKTFRVHWTDGPHRGGYRDFKTLKEAKEYKDLLDTQELIKSQQEGFDSIIKHLDL